MLSDLPSMIIIKVKYLVLRPEFSILLTDSSVWSTPRLGPRFGPRRPEGHPREDLGLSRSFLCPSLLRDTAESIRVIKI